MAELVLALFHPWREKMATYGNHNGKYQIRYLKNHFRAVQVLKSRLGEADISVAVNFFGSVGYYRELPPAEDMQHLAEEEYSRYTNLIDEDVKVEDTIEERDRDTFKFTFKL